MVLYLDEFDGNPGLLDELWTEAETCCKCKVVLQETITGKRQLGSANACSDCFYGELGDIIEQSPIASAGTRRG
jgi:hypothetical protein